MIDFDVVVAVPRLAFAVPDLDEADAALREAAGDEDLPRLRAGAVHVADVLRLVGDVEGVGGIHLHAIAEFKGLDARFELRVVLAAALMLDIERAQKIKLLALLRGRDAGVADVLDELFDLRVFRVDVGALIDAGEKAGLPVLRLLNRVTSGAHRDKTGHVLIQAAESIRDPRTKAGPDLPGLAAIHQQQRRLVIRHIGAHGPDDADVVDRLGGFRKKLADLDATLPVFLELERRAKRAAGLPLGREMNRDFLAVEFRQLGLRIERIHMRRSAVHEKLDVAFDLRGKLRRFDRERIHRAGLGGARTENARLAHDRAERERTHAHAAAMEKIAAREEKILRADGMRMLGHGVKYYAGIKPPAGSTLAPVSLSLPLPLPLNLPHFPSNWRKIKRKRKRKR